MPIDRTVFASAVTQHVSAEVAARLGWQNLTPTPDEGDNEAGRALAVALSSYAPSIAAPQVDGLRLYAADIGGVIHLTPAEAASHKLIGPWASALFGDLLGECICGGRLGNTLGVEAPVFSSFQLTEEAGQIAQGMAVMAFDTRKAPATVTLRYGKPTSANFARVNVVDGDAVFSVGVDCRPGEGGLPVSEPEAPSPSPAALH
jgi:hypothetical protein